MSGSTNKNTKTIAIAAAIIGVSVSTAVAVLTVGPTLHRSMTARDLLTTGRPATATIISLTDTGSRINMLPVMMLSLAVTAPDGTRFQSSAQEIVSPANAGGLQPGRLVAVRYDPDDERLVAIVGAGP